ncbi:hypothetical protein N9Y26_00195 [bacterium]|nr:hypothetical protein [bacterium]
MGKGIVKLGEGNWAVKDGNLLAAKETNGRFKNAEFTVSRGTRATYVGRDGLIKESNLQDVNLVNNGDFEELGDDLITNGTFDTDSDWTKLNATISGGKGNLDGDGQTSLLYQGILTNGKTYKVTFTVSDYNNLGEARIIDDNGATKYTITSDGTFTVYFTHNVATSNFYFRARSGAVFSIDNVSVKQVDPNDYWNLGTGWSIEDGKAYFNNPTGTEFYQSLPTDAGTYKISFDLDITNGTIQTSFNSPSTSTVESLTTSGTKTVYITTTASFSRFRFIGLGGSEFNIDNILVQEVKIDTPRIDFTDNTNGHLLLEPQSTNLITYSEDLTQLYWTTANLDVETSLVIAPDGSSYANKLVPDDGIGGFRGLSRIFNSLSGLHTVSFFAKKGEYNYIMLRTRNSPNTGVMFNLDNGTFSINIDNDILVDNSIYMAALPNDWYRCELTLDPSEATTVGQLNLGWNVGITGDEENSFSGDGVSGVYLWGAQVEALPYATSYIPTNGSTVTRDGETCAGAGEAADFNSEEGVLYAEIAALADNQTYRTISLNDGTNNECVRLRFNTTSNTINGLVRDGGAGIAQTSYQVSDIKQFHKAAFKYKSGDCQLWIDGVQRDTSADTFTLSTQTQLNFNQGTSSDIFYGKCKAIRVYKEADGIDLATLTSL